jgi:hypothetical protein
LARHDEKGLSLTLFHKSTNTFKITLAGFLVRQDFFSSGGGRSIHSIAKMALKAFLLLGVFFLIFSLLPNEASSQAEGPKATDKVRFLF